MNLDCPGCDYGRGVVCDDCLELIERKLDSSDIMAGIFGCALLVGGLFALAALIFGWK